MASATLCFSGFSRDEIAQIQQQFGQANDAANDDLRADITDDHDTDRDFEPAPFETDDEADPTDYFEAALRRLAHDAEEPLQDDFV